MRIAGRAEASAIWLCGFPVTLGCQILSISLNLLELCAKVKGIKRREI